MTRDPGRVECPECGRSAWNVDTDRSAGEIVKKYRHSPHQYPGSDTLTCTSVTRIELNAETLTHECYADGCEETVGYDERTCSDECYAVVVADVGGDE